MSEKKILVNLRPRQIYEDLDKTREDITDIGLKERRRIAWSCNNLEYRNPHWHTHFQWIN